MLRLIGVGAASISLPTKMLAAQKDAQSKHASEKTLTFFGWSDTHIPVNGGGSKL